MAASVTIDFNANLARYTSQVDKAISDLSKFQSNSDRINANLVKVFKTSFTEINSAFSLLGSAVDKFQQMASGVVSFVTDATHAQDEMGKMAQKAGMGVESFSALSYAVKLAGGDAQTLVTASKKLSENILESGRAAIGTTSMFSSLGIAVKDSSGNLRATDQVLVDVAGKFAGMSDGAEKSALAVRLFGKSGLDMIPFLNQGKDGIQALTKEAEKLGLVISKDAFEASERFNDNLQRLSLASDGLKRSIGNNALPLMNYFTQSLVDARTGGGGLADMIKEFTSQKSLEQWAERGAMALAFVADGLQGIGAVVKATGIQIAGLAASAAAALEGNFAGAKAILEEMDKDTAAVYEFKSAQTAVQEFFETYRADAGATASAVKKFAESGRIFTEEELKKQDAIRAKYGDAEKIRLLGEFEFKKQKLEQSAQNEINLLDKSASDYAALKYSIEQKLAADIAALQLGTAEGARRSDQAVVESARGSAAERITIESRAAGQVMQVWSQANAAKAAQTGGVIANAGTPGEFVSSWDASGRYVGDLGSPVSSPGALGNAYSTSGRRLSVQEQIAMLNGYARFATGGSFLVGGSGGTDSQLVAFKASPDERVTIETPAQQRASAAGGITININGAQLSASQIIAAIKQHLRTDPGAFSTTLARAG